MPIQIESAIYNNEAGQYPDFKKFDSLQYSIVGSAVYNVVSGQATAWKYSLVVSASASALGGGVSAGGIDSLRTSFSKPTGLYFVSDEALTATAYLRSVSVRKILNPTMYEVDVTLVRST